MTDGGAGFFFFWHHAPLIFVKSSFAANPYALSEVVWRRCTSHTVPPTLRGGGFSPPLRDLSG
jgi:hypothetical protein